MDGKLWPRLSAFHLLNEKLSFSIADDNVPKNFVSSKGAVVLNNLLAIAEHRDAMAAFKRQTNNSIIFIR